MKHIKRIFLLIAVTGLLASFLITSASAESVQAAPTTSQVVIDGNQVDFEAYCIGGNNYFRLRDIACALSGTAKQFEAAYDGLNNEVVLTSGTAYTPIGDELSVSGITGSVAAEPTANEVRLNGAKLSLTAYVIGGTNYVKLRDIAAAFDFGVRYLSESDTIEINTLAGYTPDQPAMSFPSALDVTVIGDSVTAGVAPYVKEYFPNAYIDAKACRQFSTAPGILQQLLKDNKLSPIVVVQLGTNGTVKESDVYKVIDLVGADRKLVFVSCRVPRSWCEGDNKTFFKIADEYENVMIADWYGASFDQDSYFYKDGFHPNIKGCKVLAKVIADAVAEIYAHNPSKPYIPVSPSAK
jgi:lysophospholipase L1-like esterase